MKCNLYRKSYRISGMLGPRACSPAVLVSLQLNRWPSFASLRKAVPLVLPHSLKAVCKKGGVGGRPRRGRLPPQLDSEIDLWQRGPSRAPVAHEAWAPLCGGLMLNVATAIRRQGIRASSQPKAGLIAL